MRLTFFRGGDVGAQVDVAERARADLAAQPILVAHAELHDERSEVKLGPAERGVTETPRRSIEERNWRSRARMDHMATTPTPRDYCFNTTDWKSVLWMRSARS